LEKRSGQIPKTREELLELTGVGRYTAGALMSIAVNRSEAILDGNVTRILCRIFEVQGNPKQSDVNKELWRLAAALVPRRSASDFNQALMELGATLCLSQKPHCRLCPVHRQCAARKHGTTESLPRKDAPGRSEKCVLASVLVRRGGRLLILKRDHPSLLTGLWEIPMVELPVGSAFDLGAAARLFQSEYGLRFSGIVELGTARHVITYRRITLHVCQARLQGKVPAAAVRQGAKWILPAEIHGYGVSSLSLKSLRLATDYTDGTD
jgi:A/G-specific adenine glycosylase